MDDAYGALADRVARISYLRDAMGLLQWDQQVTMPAGGTPARSRQRGALSAVTHDLLTDDDVGAWLDAVEDEELSADEAAVVREVRREYERETAVPADLVERLSERESDAQARWEDAKAADDFDAFAPVLADLRELRIERADHVDPGGSAYETLYDDQMPTLPYDTAMGILADLTEALPPLLQEIRESGDDLAQPFAGETVPAEAQAALSEATLDLLGYDREHGRLDTAAHPFTSGTQYDSRITTRYREDDPFDGLTATIHEFGHATYQLGLDRDAYGSPLGSARGEVHESQSRFWENHVGRSRAFWETFAPVFREHVPGAADVSVDALHERVNRVTPENCIRVEADELTYHLHIAVRAEIEREYVDGDLATDEIPGRWRDLMDEYLGVVPETDAEGALQDVHWTRRFGGFQTYTVGSVVAAQLTAAMREDLDLEGCIRDRAFDHLREWMTEHVHRHGQRYETPELVERATGDPPQADAFLEYVRGKFRPLYGL
ncbi:MAG: carboxypeptidase M32 [Halorientalis sp.]